MTIRLLCDYDRYPANAIVSLDAGTEAGLIAAKRALSDTTGGVPFVPVSGPAQLRVGAFTVRTGRAETIRLLENQALTVSGATGTVGSISRLDAAGAIVGTPWAVGAGTLPPIGSAAGGLKLVIACTAGSIDATVGDAALAFAPYARPSLKAMRVVVGSDSRTSATLGYAMPVTSPTFVRAGGSVAFDLGQAHNLVTNNKIRIENLADAGGTNDFSGWFTITRTGANTGTYPDPRPDATAVWGNVNARSSSIFNEQYTGKASWFDYANAMYCDSNLTLVRNIAISGAQIADMLPRMPLVVSDNPDLYIAGPLGVNNLNTKTVAQMYADTLANYAMLQAAGIPIVHMSEFPILSSGSGAPIFSAANVVKAMQINDLMAAYCAVTPGMTYCNVFKPAMDPASSPAGQAMANVTQDGLHQGPYGARFVMAKALGPVLQKIFPTTVDRLPISSVDTYASTNTSKNLTGVGWVSTAGGSTGGSTATITGLTVCAGMQVVAKGASAVCTGAPTARADGFGYDQVCVFTAGASGDSLQIFGENITTNGKVSLNDLITGRCSLSFTGVAGSKLKQFQVTVAIDDGGSITSFGIAFAGSVNNSAQFGSDDFTLSIKCPPAVVHSLAGNVRLNVLASFDGAGTALTVKFGRPALNKNES